jgi:hypothetical protein
MRMGFRSPNLLISDRRNRPSLHFKMVLSRCNVCYDLDCTVHEGRMGCSTRPRQIMALLLAVTFLAIVWFSQQSYGALFGLDPSVSPQDALTFANQPQAEPVVFALIMYSETSAKEGAILIKVLPSNLIEFVPG